MKFSLVVEKERNEYLRVLLQVVVAWVVFIALNILIIHYKEGVISFRDVENWHPFAVVLLVAWGSVYIKNRKKKKAKA